MDLYYFDHYQFQNLSFDFLKGLFNAFEFINHRVNHGCSYDLAEYNNSDVSLEQIITSQLPSEEGITFSLLEITKAEFEKSLKYWFFHFIEDIDLQKRSSHNFFEPEEQNEFINHTFGMIERVTKPITFYAVGLSKFSYSSGLFSDWCIIISEDKFYTFRFSWSD